MKEEYGRTRGRKGGQEGEGESKCEKGRVRGRKGKRMGR